MRKERDGLCKEKEELSALLLEQEKAQEGGNTQGPNDFTRTPSLYLLFKTPLCVCAERAQQAVSEANTSLRAELDEERRKYQGLLRDFNRLEQRYENLREMSSLTEVGSHTHTYTPVL